MEWIPPHSTLNSHLSKKSPPSPLTPQLMSDIAIRIESLSKQYRLGAVNTGTLHDDLNRWWRRIRGKEDPYLKIGETNDRALKPLDFTEI